MKKLLCLLILLLAFPLCASGEETPDTALVITPLCRIKLSSIRKGGKEALTDGRYNACWTGKKRGWVEITAPDESPCYGAYLQWADPLVDFSIQIPDDAGEWQDILTSPALYYNQYIELPGLTRFRIQSKAADVKQEMGICELTLFGAGEAPAWVQKWRPFEGKADLLVLSTHPDDELIFLGGTIPYYVGELGDRVQVAYVASMGARRKIELLDGLWTLGVREYPQMPPNGFRDFYSSNRKEILSAWGEEKVLDYISWLFRRYRPDVVVTQDLKGEYGHGAHKTVAWAAKECVTLAAQAEYGGKRSGAYPAWQIKKLYLHLYKENQITMDWSQPLSAFGGRTAFEMACQAYQCHRSQCHGKHQVVEAGPYDNRLFGLYFSSVGPDVQKNDFLENTRIFDWTVTQASVEAEQYYER